MFNSTLRLVRGASRIQARSPLRPSTHSAGNVIASAARGRREKRYHGSQHSNKSGGEGPRHNGRLPLRPTAIAGFSILTVLANSDDSKPLPQPNCVFKDPSGWGYMDADPSLLQDFIMNYDHAKDVNSIDKARRAQFEFTRSILQFCVHGEVIEEGPMPADIVFGPGWYVAKEDTRVFWVPSPTQGKDPVLCLSVHHDLVDELNKVAFVDSVFGVELAAICLGKFKDGDTHVQLHFSTPGQFFALGLPRDGLVRALELYQSLAIAQ